MAGDKYKEHLRQQLAFLGRSCAAYDEGCQDEAIRMATVIRVLLHKTPMCVPLLEHLGATDICLLSGCGTDSPNGSGSLHGFLMLETKIHGGDGEVKLIPMLDEGPHEGVLMPAEKWWNQAVFSTRPAKLTRKRIVLAAANQDGGAHVDRNLDRYYKALKGGLLWRFVYTKGGRLHEEPAKDSHFPAIRQMAYELLHSPDLLRLAE